VPLQDHKQITQSPDDVLALDEALSRFACEVPAKGLVDITSAALDARPSALSPELRSQPASGPRPAFVATRS
jgi:hypothetical protein